MSLPTPGQVVFLSSQVAGAILENAAALGHDETLRRVVRTWLPDRTEVDDATLKAITATVRENLLTHRALLLNRVDRLVAEGRAEAL
jgi:hypothetical protein